MTALSPTKKMFKILYQIFFKKLSNDCYVSFKYSFGNQKELYGFQSLQFDHKFVSRDLSIFVASSALFKSLQRAIPVDAFFNS